MCMEFTSYLILLKRQHSPAPIRGKFHVVSTVPCKKKTSRNHFAVSSLSTWLPYSKGCARAGRLSNAFHKCSWAWASPRLELVAGHPPSCQKNWVMSADRGRDVKLKSKRCCLMSVSSATGANIDVIRWIVLCLCTSALVVALLSLPMELHTIKCNNRTKVSVW